MDIEKMIERLEAWNEQHLSVVCGNGHFACDYLCDSEDCIVVQAATALTDLLARAEAAEAANSQLNGTVTTLMESNRRLVEELKAYMETDLAKAHDALSADWAKQKQRAKEAEARAEKAERERDEFKAKYIEAVNRACELSKIVDDHGWEE